MASTAVTSLKLEVEMKARVQRLADSRRRTSHWIMREAIEEYVTREEQRQSFHQDALAAWQNYQATGLHVTGEEMDAWFEKLENGEAAPVPGCHT